MGRKLTVVKEAEYKWNVIRKDGSIVCGPLKYKREAAAFAEIFNRTPEIPDAGGAAHSGNTASANNKQKNEALPQVPAHQQTKKTTVAATPTPAPAQLRCACGWIVIPAVAYQHFEECPSFRKL
jgi:hypothetical protein